MNDSRLSNRCRRAPRILAALGLAAALHAQADVVVVVHAASPAALDDEAVAKLFLKQVKAYPDGSAATPLMQKESALTEEFRSRYLKKNLSQYKAYWAQQVFTGNGKAPSEIEGDEAVLKYVAETPGAIGYVSAAKGSGVKVVKK